MDDVTDSTRAPERVTGFGVVKKFVLNNTGWTFNFVMAHVLFWAFGFPALMEYGYTDKSFNSDGGIPSGPSGSAVGILSTLLCAAATFIYGLKLVTYDANKVEEDA